MEQFFPMQITENTVSENHTKEHMYIQPRHGENSILSGRDVWRITLMRNRILFVFITFSAALLLSGCFFGVLGIPDNQLITNTIAGHEQSLESVLRSIPEEYINEARTTFHIAYQHTSHGTHVSRGMHGLEQYKAGDDVLFGISNSPEEAEEEGKLDFRDCYHGGGIPGADYDLSVADDSWDQWLNQNRAFLDDPANAEIDVILWSWCNIGDHDVVQYCTLMQVLIDEYGENGTKIGTGAGDTRTVPVHFIFMTGHGNGAGNPNPGQPESQARIITDFCEANGYFCLDFFSNDSHTMEGVYYIDAGDNGNSSTYQATVPGASDSFNRDWQDSHILGTDYFQGRNGAGGPVSFGDHTDQHITLNRNAYALWWILARMAGWGEE